MMNGGKKNGEWGKARGEKLQEKKRSTANMNFRYLRSGKCYFSITHMRTELVTTLKRKATEIISKVDRERVPVLITQHGRPAAYLVDVETYERLNQRLAILEGIARGERAIEQGRVVSHAEAKKRLARWLS